MGGIFLSYSRDSADVADALANDLKELGHAVWFDDELSGGQTWWDQILTRIRACDVFVFALTPQSLSSSACNRERDYAAALGKPILPVLLSDGISINILPPALAQIQHLDYRSRDRAAGLKLARALGSLPVPGPLPDPLPTPPDVPMSYLGGLAAQAGKPGLSYDEQSSLLFDLKRALRDTETTADARTLLKQLRKRRDVYAAIAEEIDVLITAGASLEQPLTSPTLDQQKHARGSAAATALAPPRTRERPTSPIPTPVTLPNPAHLAGPEPLVRSSVRGDLPTARERQFAALVGAVVGSIIGVWAVAAYDPDVWFLGFALGVATAIAGAIAGTRTTVIAGATVGVAAGWLLAQNIPGVRSRNIAGAVLGGPPGVIVGAIVGACYLRIRRVKVEDPQQSV